MRLDSARGQLSQATRASLETFTFRLNEARARHQSFHPERVLERRLDTVKSLRLRFERAGKDILSERSERLARLRGLLRTLGPESAFHRGFSITLAADGKIVTSSHTLKPGDLMRTKFADGEALSIVEKSPTV